jgi:uncharacterized protein YukE
VAPPPTTPPGLEPLRFDQQAALAAFDACTKAAVAVDAALAVRDQAAKVARLEWRGPARDEFDRDLRTLDQEAVTLAADLRRVASAIGTARETARVENASRREARILWQRSQLVG